MGDLSPCAFLVLATIGLSDKPSLTMDELYGTILRDSPSRSYAVVERSAASCCRKGLLERVAHQTYALTEAGDDALTAYCESPDALPDESLRQASMWGE